jgi:hypothetical protein
MSQASGDGRGAPDEGSRPWLSSTAPVAGIVLAVLGLMLLIQQTYPGAAWPQAAFVFLTSILTASVWAIALYIGTIVTLMTMPLLVGLGIALLIAAVLRALAGEGIGWQALVGAVLVALGWNAVLDPPTGGPFVPVILVAIGAGLLSRRRGAAATPGD